MHIHCIIVYDSSTAKYTCWQLVQCDKESGLKQLSWCTNAFTAWLHHTWHHTANQYHPALVGLICDPPRLANLTFLAWRLTMGREVSLSMDQLSGTAYLLNFGLTSRWTFSKLSWRHFCLTADLAHLMYFILILRSTKSLITIITIVLFFLFLSSTILLVTKDLHYYCYYYYYYYCYSL